MVRDCPAGGPQGPARPRWGQEPRPGPAGQEAAWVRPQSLGRSHWPRQGPLAQAARTWRRPALWLGGRRRPGSQARRPAAGVGAPRGPGQPCWLGPPAAASLEAAGTQSSLCAGGGLELAGAPERCPGEGRSAAPCPLPPWVSLLSPGSGLSPGSEGGLREDRTHHGGPGACPDPPQPAPARSPRAAAGHVGAAQGPPHPEHLFCLPGLCRGGLRAYPLHSAPPSAS